MNYTFCIVFLIGITQILAQTTIRVSVQNLSINAITTYTWQITTPSLIARDKIILNFPPAVNISNAAVSFGGTNLTNIAISGSQITLNSLSSLNIGTTSPFSLIVTGIVNPFSAISSFSYFFSSSSISTTIDSNIQQSPSQQTQFLGGNFISCPWTFTGCTQQAGSTLSISVTTINQLPSGTNKFIISYPSQWPNLNFKSLTTPASSITCTYSIDGGLTFQSATSCTIETTFKIIINFNLNALSPSGTSLVFTVSGIVNPPTQITVTSNSFAVSTSDSSNIAIDSQTNCNINPICISNLTGGVFNNPTPTINSLYNTPSISFTSTKTITFMAGDIMEIDFASPSNFVNCSGNFVIVRNGAISMNAGNILGNSRNYSFPIQNTDYNQPISLFFQCNLIVPPSQTPQTMAFKFYRNSYQYLELSAILQPKSTVLTKASLSPNTTEMGAIATYIITITTSHALGANGMIYFYFPSDINLNSFTGSCSGTISGGAVFIGVTCTKNISATSIIMFKYTTASIIPSNTTLQITLNSIINALYPNTYSIGVQTYYDAVNTSKVQTNLTATSITFSVLNINALLTPNYFSVYSVTPATISLTTPIIIPSGTTFQIVFPPQVVDITIPSNFFTVAAANSQVTSSSVTLSTKTIVFTIQNQIQIGNLISIAFSVKTPTLMGNYDSIQLTAFKNGISYLQSLSSMVFAVNTTIPMGISIIPNDLTTGKTTDYNFTINIIIPHPPIFLILVNVPADTQLAITNSTNACNGTCNTAVTLKNSSSFYVNVSNPSPNSANTITIQFKISKFINARSIGVGSNWNLTTMSTSYEPISITLTNFSLQIPNKMTGVLSLADSYYRSNNNSLKIIFSFFNNLISGDYILLSIDRTVFNMNSSVTSVTCTTISATCMTDANSSPGTLVIRITPTITAGSYISTFNVAIQNLISSATTTYAENNILDIQSYDSNARKIDRGTINYNISCRDNISYPNQCRRCNPNGTCIDCYVASGFYLNNLNLTCVTSCGNLTSYVTFNNNVTGACSPCINNCQTCQTATKCILCIANFVFYIKDSSCQSTCNITAGFLQTTFNGKPACAACIDINCLVCANLTSIGCLKCNNSILQDGVCLSQCTNSSFYVSPQGKCVACDPSCYNCTTGGPGGCLQCNNLYYNSTGFCVLNCPNGTVKTPSRMCTCDPQCAQCGNDLPGYCLSCSNISLLASNGYCVPNCPNYTYQSGKSCLNCTSGCLSCTQSGCLLCDSNSKYYNSKCYSDCNLIGLQYDVDTNNGSICRLCPNGCDTCVNFTCTSCLADYSASNSQCVKTCLLMGSCETTSAQVIPLPGVIFFAVWFGIVIAIKLIMKKAYVPYSVMFLSCFIQFLLLLITLGAANNLPTSMRLLLGIDYSYRTNIKILLGLGVAFNYIQNIAYVYLFIKYIKPLIKSPRQIDIISNIVVLVFSAITNFRFGLIAFSKMFPKPYIYIQNSSKITPVHYLCIASIVFDVFPLVGCVIGIYKELPLSNLFMLSIDLLIIIILNIAFTIWFVTTQKSDDYYEKDFKKYDAEENHYKTQQAINQKDQSKTNIHPTGNKTINIIQQDVFAKQSIEDDHDSYKKLAKFQNQAEQSKNSSQIKQLSIRQKSISYDYQNIGNQLSQDVNFQPNLKSKSRAAPRTNQFDRYSSKTSNTNINKRTKEVSNNFSKQLIQSQIGYKKKQGIQEDEAEDFPDLQLNSSINKKSQVFTNEKLIRPIRVGEKNKMQNKSPNKNAKSTNEINMLKKDKKIGYFQSDAYESNEQKDFEKIIKNKISQSTMKINLKPSHDYESNNDQTRNEQISPSWYNVQNQRLDLSDFGDDALADQE